MNLPEGTHLAYIVWHEAWYADATRSINEHPHLMVGAYGDDGGCAWEFQIDGYELGGQPVTRVKMFSDSYEAFARMPEFFAALAEQHYLTLDEVRDLLDMLGAVDETPRVSPYKDREQSPQERIATVIETAARARGILTMTGQDTKHIADAVLRALPQDDEG